MTHDLNCIDHIHIFVANRSASEKWYANVLALVRISDLDFWSSNGGPLTIGNPLGTIHLALFERSVEKCRSTIAFRVTATEFLFWRSHLARVLKQSIEPIDHRVSWSLYFADPDGNPFEITSYEYDVLASQLR
jgi:catechol-2,3-dioxygenase